MEDSEQEKAKMSDLIERWKVLNAIDSIETEIEDGYGFDYEKWKEHFAKMPSVEPEALTDKEQRIFLAAMGREEKVCKQVDDECRGCMEPYDDSLVRICHEITRKVKGALWT